MAFELGWQPLVGKTSLSVAAPKVVKTSLLPLLTKAESTKRFLGPMPTDSTFGPERRIKRRPDFLRIQGKGKKIHSPYFLISYVRTPKAAQSRLGVTVTTKVHKRAVRRNYIKRCVREVFRKNRESLKSRVEMVVIARNGAPELKYAQIEAELLKSMKKGKLL